MYQLFQIIFETHPIDLVAKGKEFFAEEVLNLVLVVFNFFFRLRVLDYVVIWGGFVTGLCLPLILTLDKSE